MGKAKFNLMTEKPKIIIKTKHPEIQKDQNGGFHYEQVRKDGLPEWLQHYRENSWRIYDSLLIPDTSNEAWRRTDIKGLQTDHLEIAEYSEYADQLEVPSEFLGRIADDDHGGQIILTKGKARIQLNEELAEGGVIFTDLKTAEKENPTQLKQILGKVIECSEGKFAAMAAAFAQYGILLYIPKGLKVKKPLHSILWGNGVNKAYFSHILVLLDEGSSVTYIHENASQTEKNASMHAGLVEIHVLQGAQLNFIELQSLGEHFWNFSHERARLEENASMNWIFGAIGSHLTKNFSTLDLAGHGSLGKISGFYFSDHDQHLDHDTQQNHLVPNTTSDLLFKGALTDESRSVWQGMIYVAPGAFKTDGYQANRNLILSKKARADSIPGLEILADDVRCTHGATVGKVDKDQSFYLQSRGIPEPEAEKIIVEGFFDPIMQRIPFEGVRARFQKSIHEKMSNLSR